MCPVQYLGIRIEFHFRVIAAGEGGGRERQRKTERERERGSKATALSHGEEILNIFSKMWQTASGSHRLGAPQLSRPQTERESSRRGGSEEGWLWDHLHTSNTGHQAAVLGEAVGGGVGGGKRDQRCSSLSGGHTPSSGLLALLQ